MGKLKDAAQEHPIIPTGSVSAFFQGKWTMADLQAVLEQVTGKK